MNLSNVNAPRMLRNSESEFELQSVLSGYNVSIESVRMASADLHGCQWIKCKATAYYAVHNVATIMVIPYWPIMK